MGGKKKKRQEKSSVPTLKELGNEAFLNKKFKTAIDLYSQAIDTDVDNAILYSNRCAAYMGDDQLDLALKDAETCIAKDPNFVKGYYRRAIVYRDMDRLTDAIESMTLCVDKDGENHEFQRVLDELKKDKEEDETLPADHPERERFEHLLTWLREGGALFPKLKMRYYSENYRGVHALRDVRKDECCLYIPKSHIITLEMAKAAPVGSKMVAADLSLISPKHSYLSTYLLQEKRNSESFWQPYIDILPKSFDTFPIFYSEEEKEWLIGSPFLNLVNEKIGDIEIDYKAIIEVAPEFEEYTLEEFSWARMCVCSRIFGMQIDGVKTDGFVPLADMLNHKRPRQTSWTYSDEKTGFIIETLEEISRGDQIMDSYGRKCNSRFLLNYGFIVDNNDGNEYALKVSYNESDPYIEQKKQLIQDEHDTRTFKIMGDATEQIFADFLGYIRFLELNDDFSKSLPILMESLGGEDRKLRATNTPPLTIKNEKATWKRVKSLCLEALDKYHSSLEDDEELFADETKKLKLNHRNCMKMRMGEKEILNWYIDLADISLELIDMTAKDIRKRVTSKYVTRTFDEYLNSTILPLVRKGN